MVGTIGRAIGSATAGCTLHDLSAHLDFTILVQHVLLILVLVA